MPTEEKTTSSFMNQTRYKALALWLFGIFCFGLFLRFNAPKPKSNGLRPSTQIAQRLVLVARYGDVDDNLSHQLLQSAEQLEENEQLQMLIRGERPNNIDEEALSPVYQLLLKDISAADSGTREKLTELAQQSKQRFLFTFLLLAFLFTVALISLFSPKVEAKELTEPTQLEPWGVLGLFFAWDAIGFFILGSIAGFLKVIVNGFTLIFLVQLLTYAIFLGMFSKARRERPWNPFQAFSFSWLGKGYFLSLASVIAINIFLSKVLGTTQQSENPVLQLFVGAPIWKIGMLALLVIFIGPVFEEIVFRGWLFGGLRKKWGDYPALLASSLLFAIIHGDGPGLPVLFALGMIFGLLYKKSGSLYPSILVHSFWNATTFALLISVMP